MLELRPYQVASIDAFKASEWQRKLIVLSTGMGKTITALALAISMGLRCLWLAHRDELITQPAKALHLIDPSIKPGIVKAESNQYMRDFVFASIQSAQQERRTAQLASQGFGLVVVDEAHHALSPGYRSLLEALGCWRSGGPQLLGLTATPERSDSGALDEIFQGIVFQVGITTAIEQGYLVPPRVVERPIKIDLDAVNISRGDFGAKQLDVALMQAGIVQDVADAYESECSNRKTLIFTVSVAQSEAIAKTLRDRGHAVGSLSGETESGERKRILGKLKSGELAAVTNCMVLTEGFDEPSVDAVILARPTQSKPLMIQCVGRGLRLYPGKTDCLVVDMVGVSKRHTLVQAAVLFGFRADEQEQRKALAGERDPFDAEDYWRQRYASQIAGVKGAPRSALRWVPSGDGGWLLDAGVYGAVRMLPNGDTWHVDAVGVRVGEQRRLQLADQPVDQETAQAIAEDYVRRVNAIAKAESDARWRNGNATQEQVHVLTRAGIKVDETITKGEAADFELQIRAKHAVDPATPKQIAYLRRLGAKLVPGITKREAMSLIIRYKAGRAKA